MTNFSDVPHGWKVYVLTSFWLGIISWLNDSMATAAVVWAICASAGWILAPTVKQKGWWVASRYLTASALTLLALLMCFLTLEATQDREIGVWLTVGLGFAAALLWKWKPGLLNTDLKQWWDAIGKQDSAPSQQPDDPPRRSATSSSPLCPQCGAPAPSYRRVCFCGHRFFSPVSESEQAKPISESNDRKLVTAKPLPATRRKVWREWSKRQGG